ncbi:MAG: hypothetical protein AAGI52_08595 [Bacteroidota bacterium]
MTDPTLASFEPHVGSDFRVRVDEPPFEALTLVSAESLPAHPGPNGEAPPREPFALLFAGPAEPALVQQIVPLAHDEAGEHDLFLVPLGPDGDGRQRYEAVFA